MDAYGNPGRNSLPSNIRDVRDSHEVAEYIDQFGGECLSLRPNRPNDPAEILSGHVKHRSLKGILAAHRGFDRFSLAHVSGLRGVFTHSRWHQAIAEHANFDQAIFLNAKLLKVRFKHLSLQASQWREARLEKVKVRKSDFRQAHFEGAVLKNVKWEDSSLEGAHFEGADLRENVTFVRSSLQGATFNCHSKLPFSRREARSRGMVESLCPVLPTPIPSVIPGPLPSLRPVPVPTLTPLPIPTELPVRPGKIPRPVPTLKPVQPPIPPRPLLERELRSMSRN